MRFNSRSLPFLLATFLLISFLGCSKKDDESQGSHAVETDSTRQRSTEPASVAAKTSTPHTELAYEATRTFIDLGDVLSSWVTGDKEQTTKKFLKVNWDHPEVFANVPILSITQQDFMTSSRDQQTQFMQDTKDFATNLRELGLHVLSIGEASLASGDKATSNRYYESVLQCAQSIASNDYYELIQLTAKGLIRAAKGKMSQLEGGQQNSGVFDIKEINIGDQSWGQNLLAVKIMNRTEQKQPFWLHIGGRYQDTGRARGFGMGMEQPIQLEAHEERIVKHPYWIPPQVGQLSCTVKFVLPTGDSPPWKQDPFLKKTYTVTYGTPNHKCNELTPLSQFMKEDWAEKYRNGAIIPPFNVVSTEHFVFYTLPNTLARKNIQIIQKQREKILDQICSLLGVSFNESVSFFLFPDASSKRWCMSHYGDGLAFDTTIAEIYNEETRVDPAHELTHIIASRIGNPPALLNEGFAVYMQAGHKWNDEPVDVIAANLLRNGKLVSLKELIQRHEIGSKPDDGKIAYPQSASFVKFIIDTYGQENLLKLYANLKIGAENNEYRFKDVLGVELEIAEREWKRYLSARTHEKG
jgi:hypothetical protein